MTKNDYFYAFSDYIVAACEERSVQRNRTKFVKYFQDNWEMKNEAEVLPADFAEEAIASLGLKRKLLT